MTLQVDHLIMEALREDISSEDVTTNAVMHEAVTGEVDLICKQDGVIAGLQIFQRVFELLDKDTKVEFFCKDGDEVKNGQLMGKVTGDIRVLLSGERVALNYLQRMSGIASYTHSVASLLEGSKTKLLDTRKTTPNMRIFEKYAVRVGGGYNHTLLSGIVGVSNIMLITVKERTREFGVRKAIGAKPWSILKLIITESIIITSFFGYIGMVCGVAANEIMDATIGHTTIDTGLFKAAMFVNPTVGLGTCIGATIAIVIAGTIAGLIPAIKAARIRPIEALRAE